MSKAKSPEWPGTIGVDYVDRFCAARNRAIAVQSPRPTGFATNLKTANLGKVIAVAQEANVVYADADTKLGLSHRPHTVGIEIECDQK